MTWSVPRMWDGETVAILASGPSMNQEVADACRIVRTIAVNTTFKLAPWADMLYASDAPWWMHYREEVAAFAGLKVGSQAPHIPVADLLLLKNTGMDGFDPDPSCVRSGRNSGYSAMHVATHAGAKRILLCGFDMRAGHWHDPHPTGQFMLRNAGDGVFEGWIKRFATLKPELDKRGVEVLNCTPNSALRIFPMADLKETLETRSLSPA